MYEPMEKTYWIQNIVHDSQIKLTLKDDIFSGKTRLIDKISDPKLELEISKLMSAKPGPGFNCGVKTQLIILY